jgi:hypothetical protein
MCIATWLDQRGGQTPSRLSQVAGDAELAQITQRIE